MDPIENQLRILKSLGFGVLTDVDLKEDEQPAVSAPSGAEPRSAAEPSLDVAPLPLAERVEALAQIASEVAECQGCRLCNSRTNTVPGEGNPEAGIMFVGEGPGAEEDKRGRPFVGRAGELLTKIIEAMQFRREEVFIANVVKCRPPGNRTPEPDEMETCLPYLKRQIEIIRPKVLVTLGKTALVGLLPEHNRIGITKIRGRWLEFEGIPLMPTFHPAYLLRSPAQKRPVWEDMQQVMAVFGKSAKQ